MSCRRFFAKPQAAVAEYFPDCMPQYSDAGMEQSRELLEALAGLAKEKDATPAQVSLAWMLGKRPWIVPIPSSRKPERNRENAGALDIALTEDEIARIDALLDRVPVSVFGGSERDEVREAVRK